MYKKKERSKREKRGRKNIFHIWNVFFFALFLFLQYMRNSGGSQRSLPFTADPRNGAVGPTSVHPRSAKVAGNAQV